MKYNWTHLTTLMMFTDLPTNLMCHAHSLGVRISPMHWLVIVSVQWLVVIVRLMYWQLVCYI